MKNLIAVFVAVLVCFGVGFVAQYFQVDSIDTWYPMLAKPAITPPDYVFPVAWGVLYLLMGVSVGILWNKPPRQRNPLVGLFAIQLLLNFLWSVCFFYLKNPAVAFIDIVLLDIAVLYYVVASYRVRHLSAWLFAPYVLWLGFATYLNWYVMYYN